MNFYASPRYLQLVAETYFPGRSTRVADVGIDGKVLRLLIVDERDVVTEVPFLDYHEPLQVDEISTVERRRSFAPWVVREVVACENGPPALPADLEPAPFIDWSLFSSFDDYLAHFNARHPGRMREKRRQRRRLAEDLGELEFTFRDSRRDAVDLGLRWKSEQLCRDRRDDVFADPRNVRFFDLLREHELLVASTLRASGRLLSTTLGFVHDGIWSGWIFAHDPELALAKYSIGHQLLHSMLAHGFAAGHRQFDFSAGGDPYKWLHATHARILGPLGRRPRPPRSARDVAEQALRSVHLLDTARSLRRIVRRVSGR
jgi:CelD/BcsL family acetyltransferase involved in cellulose biosynthesis